MNLTQSLQLPPTTTRVERSTSDEMNDRIERQTIVNVARIALAGPDAISRRLDQLDREWDIERTLQANAASLALLSLGIAFSTDRRWLLMPALISAFLLQHALQGWCPPVAIFRRAGVRTAREINLERTALRILRGDFHAFAHDARAAILQAKADRRAEGGQ